MSGNTIGQQFTLTTYGESHGACIGGVVDGCPPGLALCADDLQADLDRRKPGQSKYTTQRNETDRVEILSGVFEGETTGTPIGLLIKNIDARSRDYEKIKDRFRPGHADYAYYKKYGRRDYRGGGRSSARETAIRVAAGGIARKYLAEHYGITIRGCVCQIGEMHIAHKSWEAARANPFFVTDASQVDALAAYIDSIRREGDSIGAAVYIEARGAPPGWGEPVFDRLDADIAKAMMSINAAKGVEIGAGFASVAQRGSYHRDQMNARGFLSNHAGGVLGGISSGQPIEVKIAFKPTSSIAAAGQTVSVDNQPVDATVTGRHDPCVGIRAVPIAEAMLALVLIDHALRDRAQNVR